MNRPPRLAREFRGRRTPPDARAGCGLAESWIQQGVCAVSFWNTLSGRSAWLRIHRENIGYMAVSLVGRSTERFNQP